ncbi:metal ABC transporter permease [Methylobacterium sp. A54F]
MKRITTAALAGLLALTTGAMAAPELQRVRGTIESADAGGITVKTQDGKSETIATDGAKYAWVVPSSLDQIKDGVFIGTATKGENPMTALEVVLFPESMRGTGEGNYAWDAITDHTAGGDAKVKSAMTNGTVEGGAPKVKSAMTNGTVESTGTGGAPKVKSAMTNGTVEKSGAADGAKTLKVTYNKDQSKQIVVPPNAPIVAFEPADQAIAKPGSKVFIIAAKDGGKLGAKFVAVGKDGLTPPM